MGPMLSDLGPASSTSALLKGKHLESKTPVIKKYLIQKSEINEGLHQKSNKQLTARINSQGPMIHEFDRHLGKISS